MTVDIPEAELREVMRLTASTTKRDAVLKAVRGYSRRRRLEELADRLHGALPDFMSHRNLDAMHATAHHQLNLEHCDAHLDQLLPLTSRLQRRRTP